MFFVELSAFNSSCKNITFIILYSINYSISRKNPNITNLIICRFSVIENLHFTISCNLSIISSFKSLYNIIILYTIPSIRINIIIVSSKTISKTSNLVIVQISYMNFLNLISSPIYSRKIIKSRFSFIKPSFNSTISLFLKVFNNLSIINKTFYSFFINTSIFFNIFIKIFTVNTRTYCKISFNINLTIFVFNISCRISTFISNIHITIYIEESFTLINTILNILFI